MVRMVAALLLLAAPPGLRAAPYSIERLGTADFSMVETTPVVWKGKLLRFESVRGNYGSEPKCPSCGLQKRDPAMVGKSYFRFRDVVTLETTPSFAPGYSFGCAFVLGDTMWAFGRGPNSTQIGAFSSTDLATWQHSPAAAQLDGFGHVASDYTVYNNNVHFGRNGTFVMAIELGRPSDITGQPFTTVFMTHPAGTDLSNGWVFRDPHTHVWPPIKPAHGYEGACPTIRYVAADDFYYLLNLHEDVRLDVRVGYGTCVVRSRDLITWESSKLNPILDFKGNVTADKGAPPRPKSSLYYTNFTSVMEAYIAKATDINNSDIDFVDFNGNVYIVYSWGNQEGTEFLGAAVVRNVTTDMWLQAYF